VRIDDTWWLASSHDQETLSAGAEVEIADTDGATLIVRATS